MKSRLINPRDAWNTSYLKRIKRNVFNKFALMLEYSFFGSIKRFAEIDIESLIENSIFATWFVNGYHCIFKKISCYTNESYGWNLKENIKKRLYFSPSKTGGAIVLTTVASNILCVWFVDFWVYKDSRLWGLNNEGILFGWILRCLLLFLGMAGLFCDAHWDNLKKSSLSFKLLNRYCKKGNLV